MALIPSRDELSRRKSLGANDINIKNDVDLKIGSSKYSAKERKPIQVDPPTLETIKNISYAKDIPMYEVVQKAVEAYLATLSEDERKLYERRPRKYI